MAPYLSLKPWQQAQQLSLPLAYDTALPIPHSTESFETMATVPSYVDVGPPLLPNICDSQALNTQLVCPGYRLNTPVASTSFSLELRDDPCNVYGNDILALDGIIEVQSKNRLHVNIKPSEILDSQRSWFDLSEDWFPAPKVEETVHYGSTSPWDPELKFDYTTNPFSFAVSRRSSNETIFSTSGQLIYEDQFLELVLDLAPGYNVYGLGEVIHGLRLGPGLIRTIYAADNGDPVDSNIYGSHPLLMETRYYEVDPTTGEELLTSYDSLNASTTYVARSHAMLMRNAHAQEIIMGERNITWRVLGGEMDMYFFSGPSAADVIRQYVHAIGLPALQQYWTFGYHQCRWGYENWTRTEEVVENFAKFGLPLETIWNDIDYMKQYRDFDNDPIRFGYDEGQKFLARLEEQGQHYVPIVDAAIYIPNPENSSDAYPIYNDGEQSGAFLLNPDGSTYIGAVWPGFTVFPDLLSNSNASAWWQRTVAGWYQKLPFGGLWIDMNEASSFCVGSCGPSNRSVNPTHRSNDESDEEPSRFNIYLEAIEEVNEPEAASILLTPLTKLGRSARYAKSSSTTSYLRTTPTPGARNINHPPYVINNVRGDLAVHAVSPNATHHQGYQEYDVHNVYGHLLLRDTYEAITKVMPGKRPFIIGRSTSVGSGSYSGHWGGDNFSQWIYMYFSIP